MPNQFTCYRWRKEVGGLKTGQVKRLKEFEKENERLRKAVCDLALEKLILREAASGTAGPPAVVLASTTSGRSCASRDGSPVACLGDRGVDDAGVRRAGRTVRGACAGCGHVARPGREHRQVRPDAVLPVAAEGERTEGRAVGGDVEGDPRIVSARGVPEATARIGHDAAEIEADMGPIGYAGAFNPERGFAFPWRSRRRRAKSAGRRGSALSEVN
jgi:hypothetical protein